MLPLKPDSRNTAHAAVPRGTAIIPTNRGCCNCHSNWETLCPDLSVIRACELGLRREMKFQARKGFYKRQISVAVDPIKNALNTLNEKFNNHFQSNNTSHSEAIFSRLDSMFSEVRRNNVLAGVRADFSRNIDKRLENIELNQSRLKKLENVNSRMDSIDGKMNHILKKIGALPTTQYQKLPPELSKMKNQSWSIQPTSDNLSFALRSTVPPFIPITSPSDIPSLEKLPIQTNKPAIFESKKQILRPTAPPITPTKTFHPPTVISTTSPHPGIFIQPNKPISISTPTPSKFIFIPASIKKQPTDDIKTISQHKPSIDPKLSVPKNPNSVSKPKPTFSPTSSKFSNVSTMCANSPSFRQTAEKCSYVTPQLKTFPPPIVITTTSPRSSISSQPAIPISISTPSSPSKCKPLTSTLLRKPPKTDTTRLSFNYNSIPFTPKLIAQNIVTFLCPKKHPCVPIRASTCENHISCILCRKKRSYKFWRCCKCDLNVCLLCAL